MLLALWSGFWDWGGSQQDNGWLGGGIYHYGQHKKATKAKDIIERVIEEFLQEPEQVQKAIVKVQKLIPQVASVIQEQPIEQQVMAVNVWLENYITYLIQQEEEEFVLLAAMV